MLRFGQVTFPRCVSVSLSREILTGLSYDQTNRGIGVLNTATSLHAVSGQIKGPTAITTAVTPIAMTTCL